VDFHISISGDRTEDDKENQYLGFTLQIISFILGKDE
jgi:hypothetical protein